MSHVSKHKVAPEVERKIVDSFMNTLLSKSLARGKARMYAILTPTERIMLAKRLAIITMLEKGESYYRVMKTLNVSTSTINRLDGKREKGDFDPLCRVFNRKLSFVDYLELFLSAGMPSIGDSKYQQRLTAMRTGRKSK